MIRTVFSIMFLVVMLPFVFLHDAIEIPYISRNMLLVFAVVAVIATLLGTYILQTKYMRQFVYRLAKYFKEDKTKDWLSKLETLNQGLGLLYKKPGQSIVVFFESGLSLLCLYCIAPALMYAFTSDIHIIDVLDRMILLNLILYFAPTPGGNRNRRRIVRSAIRFIRAGRNSWYCGCCMARCSGVFTVFYWNVCGVNIIWATICGSGNIT